MATRKKYTKKNIKKPRRYNKTHSKNKQKNRKTFIKNKRKNNINKIYFGGNGPDWLNSSQIEDSNEICPICCFEFSKTPNQAIYKTACGHLFHNNCLAGVCEYKYKDYLDTNRSNEKIPVCPICRRILDTDEYFQCMDVIAFKDKLFDEQSINKYLTDINVREIYDNQPE
jgi:hypothetical protein